MSSSKPNVKPFPKYMREELRSSKHSKSLLKLVLKSRRHLYFSGSMASMVNYHKNLFSMMRSAFENSLLVNDQERARFQEFGPLLETYFTPTSPTSVLSAARLADSAHYEWEHRVPRLIGRIRDTFDEIRDEYALLEKAILNEEDAQMRTNVRLFITRFEETLFWLKWKTDRSDSSPEQPSSSTTDH